MEFNKVADEFDDMVADMEVDNVADMVVDEAADMVADIKQPTWWLSLIHI